MSKINIGALGGLGEDGKNMYFVEVDDQIFVLDAGQKYPSLSLHGIDGIVPNMSYLVENKSKVKAILLSHGHDEAIGGLPALLREIKVPVYGSPFTIAIVEQLLREKKVNTRDLELNKITDDKILRFGKVSITFYNQTHSLPGSLGIAIHTLDGAIVYATDFSFTTLNNKNYQTSFDKLSVLKNEGVLAVLSESIGTDSVDRVSSDYNLNGIVNQALVKPGRVVFAMLAPELQRIQKVIDLCIAHNRRIGFVGRKAQRILSVGIDTGYLKVPEESIVPLKFITPEDANDADDMVIIIAGTKHEPYYMLQRMCRGQDKLVQLTDQDKVIIIAPVVPGIEKLAATTTDVLSRYHVDYKEIKKNQLVSSHADGVDLEMLYTILNPKYIFPIAGEFRHQYRQKEIAKSFGYDEAMIKILENGSIYHLVDGQTPAKGAFERIKTGEVYIDGTTIGEVDKNLLEDRNTLATDGIVIVETVISEIAQKILITPRIEYRGFLSMENREDLDDDIINVVLNNINALFAGKYLDLDDLKKTLRSLVAQKVYEKTGKMPLVMVIILDNNGRI